MTQLNTILDSFAPITLEEMSGIKLMNRIDTKFVTTMPKLIQLLERAQDEYRVQETHDERNIRYETTYFDTQRFDMYNIHLAGHTNRQKLRFRTYVSSDLQFMEVKTKNNHGRTKKKRMEVHDMSLDDTAKLEFLEKHLHYNTNELTPALKNWFDRMTLVNRAKTERLTIDTNLHFINLVTGRTEEMGPLVIIELKRDGLVDSPVLDMLLDLRIHAMGFSKYCMGSALTNGWLKTNRFKPRLSKVNKMLM